ncbi:uncharacterized protein LOC116805077 [Drosophila grimshawi]|uniref:uncharacterized protein LOC116805077 n=1 Tax=Drosophila grimshawi TaxID=7222 RepID=UPI000C86E6E6|nr:uncharacterized protein LOC116805077 [Drosophila grimshawi]
MTLKFVSLKCWLLLICCAINSACGDNACSNCFPHGECQTNREGWAAPPHAIGDKSLVARTGPYGYIDHGRLEHCINAEYRLTGDVFDYICFWNKPHKCEAVVPHYKLQNRELMKRICSDCAKYCACNNAPTSSHLDRRYILFVCFVVTISIVVY